MRAKIVNALRKVWSFHSTARKYIKHEARREVTLFKKDGTVSARIGVRYLCGHCKEVVDKIHIDHIEPVGSQPPWPPTGDGEWDRYLAGLFCDETNLQALCVNCHKIKTREEHRAGVY